MHTKIKDFTHRYIEHKKKNIMAQAHIEVKTLLAKLEKELLEAMAIALQGITAEVIPEEGPNGKIINLTVVLTGREEEPDEVEEHDEITY